MKTFIQTTVLAIALTVAGLPAWAVDNGQPVPDFTLTDTNGKTHTLSEHKGKFVVLEWFNPDCPFVKKHYEDSGNLPSLQAKYTAKDVVWLSINSSAEGKEGSYSPADTNKWAEANKAKPTALLLDGDGKVGKLYGAKATPHMYVINPAGELIYQGAIDSKASVDTEDIASSANYVQEALDAAMAGKPVQTASTKAYGCSVKY
jgi:peroxiredoxin